MSRNNHHYIVLRLVCLGLMFLAWDGLGAQVPRLKLREGNKRYSEGQYEQAGAAYHSISSRPGIYQGTALFAEGNALYRAGKYEEAAKVYDKTLEQSSLSQAQRAEVLHNIGNISMQAGKYDQAVEAYKKSLILNPADEDTRYNLVLAQKQLQKQNSGGGGGGNDQNQDQQNPQQNPQQSQSGDQDKREQKSSPNEQNQPQEGKQQDNQGRERPANQEQMSREQAAQLLDAYRQSDDETRRRVEQRERNDASRNQKQKKNPW